jgi:Flp pilus assembly CpaE family ATPase
MEPAQIGQPEVSQRVVQHNSGLRVLLAPRQVTDHWLTAAHVQAIVEALSEKAEYLILDLPAVAGGAVHQALDQADQILLVTELEALAVTCTHAELETFKKWNIFERTNLVLVSRSRANILAASTKIEKQLGVRVISVLAPAPEEFHLADSTGVPLVISNPESPAAEALVKLAAVLAEPVPAN